MEYCFHYQQDRKLIQNHITLVPTYFHSPRVKTKVDTYEQNNIKVLLLL